MCRPTRDTGRLERSYRGPIANRSWETPTTAVSQHGLQISWPPAPLIGERAATRGRSATEDGERYAGVKRWYRREIQPCEPDRAAGTSIRWPQLDRRKRVRQAMSCSGRAAPGLDCSSSWMSADTSYASLADSHALHPGASCADRHSMGTARAGCTAKPPIMQINIRCTGRRHAGKIVRRRGLAC
jgi:hypothetical protein